MVDIVQIQHGWEVRSGGEYLTTFKTWDEATRFAGKEESKQKVGEREVVTIDGVKAILEELHNQLVRIKKAALQSPQVSSLVFLTLITLANQVEIALRLIKMEDKNVQKR